MAFDRELEVAREAARLAGEQIRADYEAFVPIPDAPASISTETDRASQEIILGHLHRAFPDDGLVAEEATPTLQQTSRAGRRFWVVDPIDGTRGFAMKNGEFSVMIGLVADGELAVGVVLEPALSRATYASRGGGCWVVAGGREPTRCQVTATSDLPRAALVQSHSKPGKPSEPADLLKPGKVVETYSAGVKLAMVARGEVDLYVNTYRNFSDWDICAGHLLVEEAGGKVSELRGGAIRYAKEKFAQRGGLVATNGRLHDESLERLRSLPWS